MQAAKKETMGQWGKSYHKGKTAIVPNWPDMELAFDFPFLFLQMCLQPVSICDSHVLFIKILVDEYLLAKHRSCSAN